MTTLATTHYCTQCGALWRQCDNGSWNLRSVKAGPCCDNVAMGDQIALLADRTPPMHESTNQSDERAVSRIARVLADRGADTCNIDREDNWKTYGESYIEDARAVLAALAKAPGDTGAVADLSPTTAQIYSACLSYRHDFGLLDPVKRDTLMIEAQMWLKAWRKEFAVAPPPVTEAQPAVEGLTDDQINDKWREIRRNDDFWVPQPHILLARWAFALASSPVPMADTGAKEAEEKPAPFILGNQYRTQAGDLVRFVSVHNEGTDYETMEDEAGVNRYTRRDFGRATGTAHDYSYPGNTPPLYASPPPQSAPQDMGKPVPSAEVWVKGVRFNVGPQGNGLNIVCASGANIECEKDGRNSVSVSIKEVSKVETVAERFRLGGKESFYDLLGLMRAWARMWERSGISRREAFEVALDALDKMGCPTQQALGDGDVLLRVIQRLNSNPYSLTKSECISEVEKMRDNILAAAGGGEK